MSGTTKPAPKPPPVENVKIDHETGAVTCSAHCPTCGTLAKTGATCEVDGTVVR